MNIKKYSRQIDRYVNSIKIVKYIIIDRLKIKDIHKYTLAVALDSGL